MIVRNIPGIKKYLQVGLELGEKGNEIWLATGNTDLNSSIAEYYLNASNLIFDHFPAETVICVIIFFLILG